MAKYELIVRQSVRKDVEGIPRKDLTRILSKVEALRNDPKPAGSIKLSGSEYYRIRQGDYRIIYEVQDEALIIVLIKVGHRREVYK